MMKIEKKKKKKGNGENFMKTSLINKKIKFKITLKK